MERRGRQIASNPHVIRRKRQVQCVTTGISRHYLVPDISLDDLGDGRLDRQER